MSVSEDTDRSVPTHNVVLATDDFSRARWRARLRRWRPVLLSVLVLVLVVVGVWLIWFSSVLAVSTVTVSGNEKVTQSRILRAAQVPVGEQLVQVDLAAIQARVETIPAVREAAVSRSWPDGVTIQVAERTPVAVVDRGGSLQSLDADGVLFGRWGKAPADLPLVRTAPDVKASALAEAARVVGSLRSDIAARVRTVVVGTADEISLELRGGVDVQWGSAEESQNKADVLAALLGRKGVTTIDVSVPGRPTTR